jgi:nucleoid-associated protein EbfC
MSETQNPFGEGGFDVNALLQQAQQMQEQMMSAQQEIADTTVEGTVGDGLVTVTVTGTGDLVAVRIRKDSFDPADTEDLEDLIVAAYRDAKAKAEDVAAAALGSLTGGLGGLPGGLGGLAGGLGGGLGGGPAGQGEEPGELGGPEAGPGGSPGRQLGF